MKIIFPILIAVSLTGLFAQQASAQDPSGASLKMEAGDLSAIKQKAVAGDAQAQLSLGEALAIDGKFADALGWYRQAAAQGSVEARSRAGEMLLSGCAGTPASQSVLQNTVEGIQWTFEAATNFHVKACLNLSRSYQNGIGVNVDLVRAYAWLELYSDKDPKPPPTPSQELARQLDSQRLDEARTMAEEFKNGHWPDISPHKMIEGDPRLKLGGIMFGGKVALVSINGRTLAEGESSEIPAKPNRLKVKCLQIQKDSVLILVDGDSEARRLLMK